MKYHKIHSQFINRSLMRGKTAPAKMGANVEAGAGIHQVCLERGDQTTIDLGNDSRKMDGNDHEAVDWVKEHIFKPFQTHPSQESQDNFLLKFVT